MKEELPNGWIWSTIGEVCHNPQYGWTTKATKMGSLQLVRTTDITSGTINWDTVPFCEKEPADKEKYLLKNGDIIISRAGSVGYSLLIKSPKHSVFASYLIRFMPLIDGNFVSYFLKSSYYWNSISESKIGIAVPNVNATKLKQVSIPIAPLNEQHRIVAKIEELFTKLDAGMETSKQVQAQLKRYRQSVLNEAVEGRLTAEWRKQHLSASLSSGQIGKDELEPADKLLERIQKEQKVKLGKKYKKPMPVDTSNLPELPEGWVWTIFSHIGELNRGKSKHRPRNDPKLYKGDYPFVQTGDIRNANKFVRIYSQTYNEIGLKQSRLWPRGTLCITIAANIADTAILDFDACFPDSIVGFAPNQSCNIFFIEYFLRTAKENLNRYAPATAQKNINLKILSELLIPLPPKNEQDKIVNELDRIFSVADQLDSIIEIELKRAQSLCQSILKHAFEGKLVPQNPNDEPASVLLERIKAKKAKPKKSKQLEKF